MHLLELHVNLSGCSDGMRKDLSSKLYIHLFVVQLNMLLCYSRHHARCASILKPVQFNDVMK